MFFLLKQVSRCGYDFHTIAAKPLPNIETVLFSEEINTDLLENKKLPELYSPLTCKIAYTRLGRNVRFPPVTSYEIAFRCNSTGWKH